MYRLGNHENKDAVFLISTFREGDFQAEACDSKLSSTQIELMDRCQQT
jgi:hypothetical protein